MQLSRSVRYRIAAWNSVVVALVSATAILILHQAMNWALLREIDQVLLEDGREVQLVISELAAEGLEAITDELGRKAAGHSQHRWFAQLIGEEGLLWSSRDGVPAIAAVGRNGQTQPITADGTRLLSQAVAENPLGITTLVIGSSLDLFDKSMLQIDQVVIGVLGGMFLLAPFAGYWLAGIATRPLERFTAQADALHPADMRDRLPVRGVEDEFDRLAKTINRLLDRIAQFLEEKRSFLADVAHELRTPIAAIRSTMEISLSEDRSPDEYRELLEQLMEESDSLSVLVNQVLLLSEATTVEGRPNLEEVALSDVVARSVEMFRGVAESRTIRMQVDIQDGILVSGVRRHLSQVVNNLLDNAIKYTPAQGTVSVELVQNDVHATLRVSDTGAGISTNDLPLVFNRFFRADRARQRDDAHGTGLGLAICKSIVEAHRGQISCSSRLGEGSCFLVQLPLFSKS